jgi:hypothetical protein
MIIADLPAAGAIFRPARRLSHGLSAATVLPLLAARGRLLRYGLVDCRDVSPARVAMSYNTGAANDYRTTSARADVRAASAASRDLLGAWLGPFWRRNQGGSNEHMSKMAGCVTVLHSLRQTKLTGA